jgi:hypothetical protein
VQTTDDVLSSELPLLRDRKFESISLQRRVCLDELDLTFPKADREARTALDATRAQLEGER